MKRFLLVLLALAAPIITAQAQEHTPLRLVQTIPLPSVKGRIDHLAVDLKGRRLLIAALGNDTLEVLDLNKGRHVHTISGFHEPQGVLLAPESNKIFVTNGQSGTVEIFDGDSYMLDATVKFSDDADNIRYDSERNHLYIGYGKGALGILDATSSKRLGDIELQGHPESFQLEKSGPRIFVNIPTARHIAVVDRERRAVVAIWPLGDDQANYPMALDETNLRLFVGVRKPPRLVVFDTQSGKVVARLDGAGDADDVFYDPARRRIYMSCGEGFIDVFEQRDADHYKRIAKIPTASGARTSLFVPDLNRLYLAVPRRGSQGAELRVYEVQP